jgi:hypothetical protein
MARVRALQVTVLRNGRRQDRFRVDADPRNQADLRAILTDWLEDNKWHRGRWGEFELDAREADGGSRVNATVHAA